MLPRGLARGPTLTRGTSDGRSAVILVQSGASAWGGLVAASQRHFMSIKTDASLYQVLSGMQAGAEYSLTWYAAERPAYTENERFRVEVGLAGVCVCGCQNDVAVDTRQQ